MYKNHREERSDPVKDDFIEESGDDTGAVSLMQKLRTLHPYLKNFQEYVNCFHRLTMYISKEASTEKTCLTGPDDWEAWNRVFQIRAMASHLWQNIDPDQTKVFLTEPDALIPSDFRRQTVHQTRAGTTASSITVGDTSEPQAVDRNGLTFNTAWEDQEDGIEMLRVWIMDTVSQRYLESACEPVKTITKCYSTLKAALGTHYSLAPYKLGIPEQSTGPPEDGDSEVEVEVITPSD
ncbi:hypothetical protein V1525DRAFT_435970 [Lipomyces kononenkoae]|uniref:Uncharacterized protein n=1 Tax=Lipomyces kononenkoae TaxID=34357 RepID=A0ACC3SRQ4_LIPKO